MQRILAAVARARARRAARRLNQILPPGGAFLDVGSATGHLLAEMTAAGRRAYGCDVADLHVAGRPPVLFDGVRLPFRDRSVDVVAAVHILQYPADPVQTLAEMRRVARRRVIVWQSTCRGFLGRLLRAVEEPLTGRWAFYVARAVRFTPWSPCPLESKRRVTSRDLAAWFAAVGLTPRAWRGRRRPPLASELILLTPDAGAHGR